MSSGPVLAAVAALRAAYTDLAALPVDALTHPELLIVLGGLESLNRQLPTNRTGSSPGWPPRRPRRSWGPRTCARC